MHVPHVLWNFMKCYETWYHRSDEDKKTNKMNINNILYILSINMLHNASCVPLDYKKFRNLGEKNRNVKTCCQLSRRIWLCQFIRLSAAGASLQYRLLFLKMSYELYFKEYASGESYAILSQKMSTSLHCDID